MVPCPHPVPLVGQGNRLRVRGDVVGGDAAPGSGDWCAEGAAVRICGLVGAARWALGSRSRGLRCTGPGDSLGQVDDFGGGRVRVGRLGWGGDAGVGGDPPFGQPVDGVDGQHVLGCDVGEGLVDLKVLGVGVAAGIAGVGLQPVGLLGQSVARPGRACRRCSR